MLYWIGSLFHIVAVMGVYFYSNLSVKTDSYFWSVLILFCSYFALMFTTFSLCIRFKCCGGIWELFVVVMMLPISHWLRLCFFCAVLVFFYSILWWSLRGYFVVCLDERDAGSFTYVLKVLYLYFFKACEWECNAYSEAFAGRSMPYIYLEW